MMRPVSFITLALLIISVLSTTARAENRQIITQLELRDRTVKIISGSHGLNYSVFSQDGTVLDANLNETQLAEKHPELYEKVRPAVAKDASNSEAMLWMGEFPDTSK
ncbi:hypothetical protein [Scytonema millei]|uniref:Uncharacterized protein n=1 Tax=Scytonema millei VB511283 TaxID=1245923 RepID=A0A9X5E533_9CYAN|nr:hypothetical protein [Scytonema millei]NHC35470.1 hypothetical protein [Scytonema millei VB511283]